MLSTLTFLQIVSTSACPHPSLALLIVSSAKLYPPIVASLGRQGNAFCPIYPSHDLSLPGGLWVCICPTSNHPVSVSHHTYVYKSTRYKAYIRDTKLIYKLQSLYMRYKAYILDTKLIYEIQSLYMRYKAYILDTKLIYQLQSLYVRYKAYILDTKLIYEIQSLYTRYKAYLWDTKSIYYIKSLYIRYKAYILDTKLLY